MTAEPDQRDEARRRARAAIGQHGRNTTSFQALEPGLCYWFEPDSQACVAYADTGRAWIAVGDPMAAPERLAEVAERFVVAARGRGRRVRFFAAEGEWMGAAGLDRMHIGTQPSWLPQRWPEALRKKRSLREQLRRARAKGVTVRVVASAELRDPDSPVRRGMTALAARWLEGRPMAPMGFLVQIDLFSSPDERCVLVAERDGAVVGVLSAVPVYGREGWFFEDVLRHPEAPNGVVELLFDHAMREVAARGSCHVTLGMVPLDGAPSSVLRFIRDHTRWLYDFEGLRSFKAKLLPERWDPVFLAYPRAERGVRAVLDSLAAFARGSLIRFGLATLHHRAAAVTRLLAVLLIPWTLAMAVSDTARWFPSSEIKTAWIALDLLLFILLMVLASRWNRRLATALAALAGADFVLGSVQAALYNGPGAVSWLDWVVIALALAAPLFATVFLWKCRNRATLYHDALHKLEN